MDFVEMLNTARNSGKAYAFALITAAEGATPRHPGAKMIVYEDGSIAGSIGGGEIERQVINDALCCIAGRNPVMKKMDVVQSGGLVSGSETIYIEPVFPPAHLILCGAGHVAGKLIPLAKNLGFRVSVIDIRDEAVFRERTAYLIACAFNFEQDEEILFRILQRKSAYIGMLAGNFKVQTIYNHLRARGVPDEQLRKVHAPIGLEIAAETPEEIALSIASELVFVKNQRTDNKAVSGDIPAAD